MFDLQKLDALSAFTLRIGEDDVQHWTEIELEQSIDGFSSVGFTAPFEPSRKAFRERFRPFSYAPIAVLLGGHQLQFTGTLHSVDPTFTTEERSVRVQAVALPTAICDSTVPGNFGAKEFSGLKLEDIANELCKPFGFAARFADERSTFIDTDANGELERDRSSKKSIQRRIESAFDIRFGRVKCGKEDKIFDFLCRLSKQRGVVMTDSPTGDLVFQRSAQLGRPVVHLEEGIPPLLSVTPQFNSREFYSEVTAVVPAKRGRKAGSFTLKNPFMNDAGTIRPFTYRAEDTDVGGAPQTAAAFMGRMFGEAVSWDIELPTIVDPRGEYFRPNTTLTITAPSAMIYGKHELLIRGVTKRQTKDSTTCKLNVVLPGSFSGEIPARLPWQEPL